MNGAVAAGSAPQSGRLPQRGSQPGKLAEISARPDRLPSFRYACVKIALFPFGGMSKFYALVCTGYIVPALGNHSLSNPSSVGVFGVAAQFDAVAAGAFVVVTFCAIPIAPLLAWQLVPHEPFGIAGWRWMVLIGSAGALIIWRLRRRVPEPPRRLVRCGCEVVVEQVAAAIERAVATELGTILPEPRPPISNAGGHGSMAEIGRSLYRSRSIIVLGHSRSLYQGSHAR